MPIKVAVYLADGTMSGWLARPAPLREALEGVGGLPLEGAAWRSLDGSRVEELGSVTIAADDVVLAIGDDEPATAVHATWHHVTVVSGPWVLEGDLPTMPGFDPGRALTRPSGEFVLLRDVRISRGDRPGLEVARGDHAFVNRYAVEHIRAELMLAFFFPGAAVDETIAGVGVRP
jgi:hypothetical protein